MSKNLASCLVLVAAAAFSNLAGAADADPTLNQVYDAAQSGHLSEARQMMQQVLHDHPRSAKAHYVSAELDAKAGDLGAARQELATAESIDPGLAFAKPESVRSLRSELARGTRSGYGGNGYSSGMAAPTRSGPSIPWVPILLVVGVLAVIWMVVSRRRAAAAAYGYPQAGGFPAPAGGLPPTMGGPGYGMPAGYGGYGGPAPGGGSGLLGSLASGAALGAGVVAGEELVRHVLEPGRGEGVVGRPEEYERPVEPPANDNMGGNDFGIQSDSGWDDGGSGGGGGDDWT